MEERNDSSRPNSGKTSEDKAKSITIEIKRDEDSTKVFDEMPNKDSSMLETTNTKLIEDNKKTDQGPNSSMRDDIKSLKQIDENSEDKMSFVEPDKLEVQGES